MAENLPYSTSVGTLETMLEKIKTASTPERFTQDFVSTKLAMKGGTARSCIPFLKKMKLVGNDGSPTDFYKEFRNPAKSRVALGKSFKQLYTRLYEMNEYVHDAKDQDVLGLIMEATGNEHDNAATKYTLSTFNMLRKHADFDPETHDQDESVSPTLDSGEDTQTPIPMTIPKQIQIPQTGNGINLSYTINLNLPPTKDIEVFNAIFKSLKQHLLQE